MEDKIPDIYNVIIGIIFIALWVMNGLTLDIVSGAIPTTFALALIGIGLIMKSIVEYIKE